MLPTTTRRTAALEMRNRRCEGLEITGGVVMMADEPTRLDRTVIGRRARDAARRDCEQF